MRRQSSLGVLSGFIVALVLPVAACERNCARPPTPPSVYISAPAWKEVTGWDNYIGHFEAISTVELRPRVSGYIDLVLFHDGEVVQKGTILFQIDPRPYEADVHQ